jgi:hypothetical protein
MFDLRLKQAKAGFFDRAAVMNATTRAERQVLSRFGAFVRTRARTSIRSRKTTSRPGSPPSSHLGLLKQFIFFSYDPARRGVVIGPTRLNARTGGDAPPLLEYGGNAVRKRWGRTRVVRYLPRPFMHPAYDAELVRLPALWRNSIR